MDLCLGLPCVHSSISINDSCHDIQNQIVCTLKVDIIVSMLLATTS